MYLTLFAVFGSTTPQRALLRAGFARCGGGTRSSGGSAPCLGVGRPGLGALPPPTTRPFGRAAGARFPLAVGVVCGRGGPAVLGTLSRAAVRRVLCAPPGFAAPGGRCGLAPALVPWLWPAACLSGVPHYPALVRHSSSGPVALGAPVGFPVAVVPSPTPGAVAPGFTGWPRGARGGRPRTGLIVPAAGPCRGKGAGRAPRRTRSGPRDGVVPGGSLRLLSWAACAAVVRRVWTRSLTRPVSRTVRLSTGDSAGAPGPFGVDADTAPFGSEDATPGSRACVCVRALLGRVGQAGLPRAFWSASPFLWPFLVRSLLVRPPPGRGCPVCGCCWVFSFFCFFYFSFPLLPPCCAPVVSCFACFPAPGASGLGVLSPPPPFFFPSPPLRAPRCLLLFVFSGLGCLGPRPLVAPPPPPPVYFCFCFLPPPPVVSGVSCFPDALGLRAPPPFFCCFFFPFCFLSFPVVRCGAGLCVLGRRVCPRVPRWCCPCRCFVCAGWCCLVLAVGPGCPVLSPGGSWCRASVVLSLSGRVARRPVARRGVSWCSAALCCVLLRGVVVWWCAVVLCRLFAFLPVPVVCFLPLRICCVCSGVSCCVFPVLSALCGAVLRSAGALSLCFGRRLCCSWWLVLLVPGVAAFCWGSAGGSGCPALSFGGVCRLWCLCPVWPSLGVFPVVSCSPVLCPVALCCRVVPCCGAPSSFFFVFLLAGGAGFLLFPVGSGLQAGSGWFLFLCAACAVLCWCACVVALCSVLSCPRGAGCCFVLLPVGFVCLLLGLAVLCCLLMGPGGSWCRVSVACCGVSLGAVLRRVAARCAAWRCVVVRCVVSFCLVWCCRALCCVLGRCPSSLGPVPSGAVFCLVPPRCVCFAVVCRCVVLFAVVLCAVCALGCRVVRFLLYLLEKPLQNFVKYFFSSFFWLLKIKKNYTQPNTLACSKTMYAAVSYVLTVLLDVLGLVLVRGVVERVGVHC